MAASLVVAGRESGHKDPLARQAVVQCIERYCAQMRVFSRMPMLDVNRCQVHRLGAIEPVHAALMKAERATPQHALEQLTAGEPERQRKKGAPRRFKEAKPMSDARSRSAGCGGGGFAGALRRDAGTADGSICCRFTGRWMWRSRLWARARWDCAITASILKAMGQGDPLFLQIKEEVPSAYAPYLPDAHPAQHNGQRVAEGQRAMQMQSDPFLGWTHIGGRQFLVRQVERSQRVNRA